VESRANGGKPLLLLHVKGLIQIWRPEKSERARLRFLPPAILRIVVANLHG
jgi:hypothetical protein